MAIYRVSIPEKWVTSLLVDLTAEEEKLPLNPKRRLIRERAYKYLMNGEYDRCNLLKSDGEEMWTIERTK